MSGIIELVHRAEDGPYKTIKEVAEYFERDRDTIRRWGKRLGLPTKKMMLGKGDSFVWLYSEDDMKALEAHSSTIRVGRPPADKE